MDCCGHCRVAVLFSGGLDSAVIALLLDKCLPVGESIDLINVAFPTHGEIAPQKSKKRTKNIQHQKLRKVNVSREELEACRASHIRPLLRPHNTVLDDSIGCALWFAGRGQGLVSGQPYVSPARVSIGRLRHVGVY
ncbi:hypothetical protein HAZT_HAZT008200 [Hyalella azteca]|uniref:Asparagine synthetase domain-containing protein n=1 Tax=Hyalella azteca TaxID=294128 RepID=A0A6A0HD10_HYAAZ|nr:hypothetical protein HAZT_HAZT008200 [Hyalella azteca]